MTDTVVGNIDVAQIALYAFWLFFFGLIVWIQRENMREGYPLESEISGEPIKAGFFPIPEPTTYKLPHGEGDVSLPDYFREKREFAMKKVAPFTGAPYTPTGNPLTDGVGPAAWAERKDIVELTWDGHVKMIPLRSDNEWSLAPGEYEVRGMPVVSGDGVEVGTIAEVWVDRSESIVRYFEIDLGEDGRRLLPINSANIKRRRAGNTVRVHSLYADQFVDVPQLKNPDQVTRLEEEKIMAYYAGGKLYADPARLEAQV